MAFPRKPPLTLDEIFARCEPIPFAGCWIWLGGDNGKPDGLAHGKIYNRATQRVEQVHRVAYELACAHIPEGEHLDHLCRVRMCCNPDHLECTTPLENHLRGRGKMTQFRPVDEYSFPVGVDPFEL